MVMGTVAMTVSLGVRAFWLIIDPLNLILTSPGHQPDEPRFDTERSASPRPARRAESPRGSRARSASPNGRIDNRYVNCRGF